MKTLIFILLSLFCFSCHSVCYTKHKAQDKKIKNATGKKLGQQARVYTYRGR